jgi:hypothetical protein
MNIISVCKRCGYINDDNIPRFIIEAFSFNSNIPPNSNDKMIWKIFEAKMEFI